LGRRRGLEREKAARRNEPKGERNSERNSEREEQAKKRREESRGGPGATTVGEQGK
jgi:hypothetical protein